MSPPTLATGAVSVTQATTSPSQEPGKAMAPSTPTLLPTSREPVPLDSTMLMSTCSLALVSQQPIKLTTSLTTLAELPTAPSGLMLRPTPQAAALGLITLETKTVPSSMKLSKPSKTEARSLVFTLAITSGKELWVMPQLAPLLHLFLSGTLTTTTRRPSPTSLPSEVGADLTSSSTSVTPPLAATELTSASTEEQNPQV